MLLGEYEVLEGNGTDAGGPEPPVRLDVDHVLRRVRLVQRDGEHHVVRLATRHL